MIWFATGLNMMRKHTIFWGPNRRPRRRRRRDRRLAMGAASVHPHHSRWDFAGTVKSYVKYTTSVGLCMIVQLTNVNY